MQNKLYLNQRRIDSDSPKNLSIYVIGSWMIMCIPSCVGIISLYTFFFCIVFLCCVEQTSAKPFIAEGKRTRSAQSVNKSLLLNHTLRQIFHLYTIRYYTHLGFLLCVSPCKGASASPVNSSHSNLRRRYTVVTVYHIYCSGPGTLNCFINLSCIS